MPIDSIRRTIRRAAIVVLTSAVPITVQAQATVPLAAGARVRITIRDADPGRSTGTLVALGADTLRYRPDGDSASRVVLLGQVKGLDVSRGVHRHTWQGLITGAAVGALTGVVVGYASGDDPKQEFLSYTRGDKAGILGAAFGVIGGGIGTIIGFAHRSEDWQRVQPPYTLTLAPEHGGTRLAMRIRF